ncbi:hypothetical protein WDV76_06970 [Xenorhabdus griffiniae]|uniref:hypothetical protein n=1 Tax=Xenorhabdus griffiniae TaxID=351672 RepID=UPI0030CEBB04
MAGKITIDPPNGKIIKGQPFSVTVSITGEQSLTASAKISVAPNPTGVKLIKAFTSYIIKGNLYQQLIFQADKTSSDYKISFTTNLPGISQQDVTYTAADNQKMKPDSLKLTGTSSYLYDPNPVAVNAPIPPSAPFIPLSINPLTEDGHPISKYDIHLRTESIVRIFTEEDGAEILPYDVPTHENPYYDYLIQKKSKAAVNLNIYATPGLSEFVTLETVFNLTEAAHQKYDQTQVIFINTVPINIDNNFDGPRIEETNFSSTLIRPAQTDDFHFMVQKNGALEDGGFIIGFVTDDEDNIYKKQLCFGRISDEKNESYIFIADYENMYEGDNYISYVTLNKAGTLVGSELRYINYNSGGNNSPAPNDSLRPLVAPDVYDQYGNYINLYKPININSIGNKGLEVWLLSDPTKQDTTITEGNRITIKAYISYCDDERSPARKLPIMVAENHTIGPGEIKDGYFKVTIPADKLMDYRTSSDASVGSITIDYISLPQNQKSKLFTRAFDTSIPD